MPRQRAPRPRLAAKHQNAAGELEQVDRDQLHEMMLASGEARFVNFAAMLENPRFDDYSLAELCAKCGIGPKETAALFKEQQIAVATIRQMRYAEEILETNAEAAVGRRVLCPTCRGRKVLVETCDRCSGKEKEAADCKWCSGTGLIEVGPCLTCEEAGWVMGAGDRNAVNGFLESAGLRNSGKGGPLVNINNFNGAGSFEELIRDSEKVYDVKGEPAE